jgi:hypothetical protein
MSLDFFSDAWEIIYQDLLAKIQQMCREGVIMHTQKHGMVVCLQKIQRPTGPEDY